MYITILYFEFIRLVQENLQELGQAIIPVTPCSSPICKVERVWLEPDTEDDWEIMVRMLCFKLDAIIMYLILCVNYLGFKSRSTSIIVARPNGDSSAGGQGCDICWGC